MTTTISRENYLQAAHLFGVALMMHFVIWFTGVLKRHKRTEVMLPRLVSKKKLHAVRFGNQLVYVTPQKARRPDALYPPNITHRLGVTEGLVRFFRADMTGTIIPSSHFRGLGAVPEWGIKYNGSLLLYEFCTFDNHYTALPDKVQRYPDALWRIEQKFQCKALVVFVSDVNRTAVTSFVQKRSPVGPFLFTDFATFKNVPIGEQLTSRIYLWGEDGQPYSMKNA